MDDCEIYSIIKKKSPKLDYTEEQFNAFFDNDIVPFCNDTEFLVLLHPYTEKLKENLLKEKYKYFFIFRDPRDQIISHAFEIKKYGFLNGQIKCEMKIENIIELLIIESSDYYLGGIEKLYCEFLPWINCQSACVLKFENLVG